MASLQELLKEEGFEGPGPRLSSPSRASTMPNQTSHVAVRRTRSLLPGIGGSPISGYTVEPQVIDEAYDEPGTEIGSSCRESVHSGDHDASGSEIALDRIVTKAVISILTGHLRRYFKDESIRMSTYRRCLSCLGIDDRHEDVGVVASLKEAMRSVERAVAGRSSPVKSKKATLELSVIAGLSSADVTNAGCTFGIPNSHLAACAHLYLAAIRKFQRKDSASAKHVLQVFCNSPNQARTTLLPRLWERFLLPHLSHLKEWFDLESESISGAKNWEKRNALLEELYSKILDTATYQLAVYYKDWLEGVEAPDFPSILVPNVSRSARSDESGTSSIASSRAMVSKKLDEPGEDEEDSDEEFAREHEILLADEWEAEGYYRSSRTKMRHTKSSTAVSRRNRSVQRKRAIDADMDSSAIDLSTPSDHDHNCRLTGQLFKDEAALLVVEQLLTGFSTERRMENARYVVSLGGLQFLLSRLESGDLEEKSRVASLLICCIQADGSCRSYLAVNIAKKCVLELLHSKRASARTAAVSLLIELICLSRRTLITQFLNELKTEAILNTVHVLHVQFQNSTPEEKPLVAVLLLHFDQSFDTKEAVDGITMALDRCLSERKVVPSTRRALLMLAGHFSTSGEVVTEAWLLKQAGFYDACDYYDEDGDEPEAKARGEWSRTVSLVLLGSGKRSFLVTLARCLGSENAELAKLCLTTVTWLSHTLSSLSLADAQLSAFSAFVPRLKETLLRDPRIEHKVLASFSLHNFAKISECRVLLLKFGKEMHSALESLMEVTWTANHLFAAVCEGLVDSTTDTASESSP